MCGRSMTFYVREKTSFDVLYNKQAFLNCENYRFKKPTLFAFFQSGYSMVLVKKLKFC